MASIRAGQPPGEAFRTLARKTLTAAAKDLKAAGEGQSVHLARKRLKFMRSLLRFIRHAIKRRDFETANGRMRRAAAVLAGARRCEALQEAVVKLQAEQEALLPELGELATIAAQAHGQHATPQALQAACAEARRIIAAARREVAHWTLAKRDIGPYLQGLTDAYGRARRKLRNGLSSGSIAALHEARKSVIHHLHQLEMLKPLWPGMIKMWAGELLKLREALGDLNDLEELEALAIGQGPGFSSGAAREKALQAIAARRTKLLNGVRAQVDQLFAEKPKAFARRMGAMWQVMLA